MSMLDALMQQLKPAIEGAVNEALAATCAQNGGRMLPAAVGVVVPKPNGGAGGCGCGGGGGGGGGGSYPVPGGPSPGMCGIRPGSIPPVPLGTWNCERVRPDLAPCDVSRIEREKKLATFTGELAGPIAEGAEIAVEFVPIGISHQFCVEFLKVTVNDGGDPPIITPIPIPEVSLQPEILVQNPDGSYSHAWDYRDPERPSYLGITDGRCACVDLCDCTPRDSHVRVVFTLPQAILLGQTLKVEVWGRRKDWMVECGPCPPCDQCDHELLNEEELKTTEDHVYVLAS